MAGYGLTVLSGLSRHEMNLLRADIEDLAREMDCDYLEAASEHRSRVGGDRNLRGYVACLVAGEARRKREASK